MNIIPSIDLYQGQVVRLRQGDFQQQSEYALNIQQLMQDYEKSGFKRVHIVDLSGAEKGLMEQADLIAEISGYSKLEIQVGGGIRCREDVERLFSAGITRVVIGSLAVENPELVQEWIMDFGADRIVLAIDVNLEAGVPMVMTQGWKKSTALSLKQLLASFNSVSLSLVLCTDIQRDGLLQGPNIKLYEQLLRNFPAITWIASGGVSSMDDLKTLQSIGVQQVIVGKALYEGRLTLQQCQEAEQW